jgi:hypothetical protein
MARIAPLVRPNQIPEPRRRRGSPMRHPTHRGACPRFHVCGRVSCPLAPVLGVGLGVNHDSQNDLCRAAPSQGPPFLFLHRKKVMKAMIVVTTSGGDLHLPFEDGVYRAVQALLSAVPVPTPTPAPAAHPKLAHRPCNAVRYTPEFRTQAVRAYLASSDSLPTVASQLGVPHSTLDKWVRDRCGTTARSGATQ